jgi:hypothetical protein
MLLPMYRSRFREYGSLISAVDICNRTESELFPNSQRQVSPTAWTSPLSSPFQNTKFETFLWDELFSVACELHGLSYMLDLYIRQRSKIGAIQREFFEDTFAGVQHNLISFPYPADTDTMQSTAYYRQNCWRLAAMIYLNTAIRAYNPISVMVQSFVTKLIPSLRLSDLPMMWSSFPEVLMWMAFMGRSVAMNESERYFFSSLLKQGKSLLNLNTASELEGLLQPLLYREVVFGGGLSMIWEEVNNTL